MRDPLLADATPADDARLLPSALRTAALGRWWTLALLAAAVNALLADRLVRAAQRHPAPATAQPPAPHASGARSVTPPPAAPPSYGAVR